MFLKLLICVMVVEAITGYQSRRLKRYSEEFGTNRLVIEMFKLMSNNTNSNVMLGTTSLIDSLAVLYEGSAGQTENTLAKVLQFPTKINLRNSIQTFKTKSRNGLGGSGVFEQVTAVISDMRTPIRNDYKKILRDWYGGICLQTDVTNLIEARETINSWVRTKTKNTIKNLIEENDLGDNNLSLMIVSASFFKAAWMRPFDKEDTKPRKFTLEDGSVSIMQGMHETGVYRIKHSPLLKAKLLNIPYKSSVIGRPFFSMVIILPDRSIKETLNLLDFDSLKSEIPKSATQVEICIPKFVLENRISLKDALAQVGLSQLFSQNLDLSNLAQSNDAQLYLTDALQVTHFEVDETGTTASSATEMKIGFRSLSIPEVFIVDRPFLFAIIETSTNFPIYLGKIARV